MDSRKPLRVGDRVRVRLPWSEVCLHMRVADREMDVEVLADGMAQLRTLDGALFSAPITWGEAGVYRDRDGRPYL
ncbi:hypothetical protein [Embleya sp. NPDC059237]|uniref:hypothetical protein n=1 Tax=Embleya sp. NPDC059237 TaxID=3346784 RepID=UPI0036B5FDF4